MGTRQRPKTVAPQNRLTKEERKLSQSLPIVDDPDRPRTRLDCEQMPRPCPYVSCKHHLYLDVNPETGSIKRTFPDLEVEELAETCSLDVANSGGETLERVGFLVNLTRERIRQIEVRGLVKLRATFPSEDDLPDFDPGPIF